MLYQKKPETPPKNPQTNNKTKKQEKKPKQAKNPNMRWPNCPVSESSGRVKSEGSGAEKTLLGKLISYFGVAWGLTQTSHLTVFQCGAAVTKANIWDWCVKRGQLKTSLLGGFSHLTSDIFPSVCTTPNTFFHIIYSCCAHLDVGGDI